MPHASLEAVSQALLKALGGNEATYKTVATRITLRTGVNVREPSPAQARDSASIAKVVDAANALGYSL